MKLFKSLLSEIKMFASGQTIDAIIPTLMFVFLSSRISLLQATIASLLVALVLFVIRRLRKEKWYYAIGGLMGVVIACGFVIIFGQSKNYFLPDIVSSLFIMFLCLITLKLDMPLAAWLSHLTRSWPIEWFKRKDIRPAYRDVTIIWLLFFMIRFALLLSVYFSDNTLLIVTTNLMMGLPFTLLMLSFSYIYGMLKLKALGGPGVDEYKNPPPWKGQKKGF